MQKPLSFLDTHYSFFSEAIESLGEIPMVLYNTVETGHMKLFWSLDKDDNPIGFCMYSIGEGSYSGVSYMYVNPMYHFDRGAIDLLEREALLYGADSIQLITKSPDEVEDYKLVEYIHERDI